MNNNIEDICFNFAIDKVKGLKNTIYFNIYCEVDTCR